MSNDDVWVEKQGQSQFMTICQMMPVMMIIRAVGDPTTQAINKVVP